MLGKTVCQRCVEKHEGDSEHPKKGYHAWTESDEKNWETSNEVMCPPSLSGEEFSRYVKTEKRPPDWCPYELEHFLETGVKCGLENRKNKKV